MRIRLNRKNVENVHMMATLGPVSEAIFSLRHVGGRGEPGFRAWDEQVSGRLRSSRLDLEAISALRRSSDLTWLLAGDGTTDERLLSSGLRRSEVRSVMERYTDISVNPYWPQMLAHLGAAREERIGGTLDGGENLLNSLHPGISWKRPFLEISGGEGVEIELNAKGLLIAPSIFLGDRPAVFLRDVGGTSELPVLVFSVRPAPTEARALWTTQGKDVEALDALMGRTRAQLLRLTLAGGTTSELARSVGTSAAAVSQHTGILRNAGLILSERDRNTVVHRITSLGRAVLHGNFQAASTPAEPVHLAEAASTREARGPRPRQPFAASRKRPAPAPLQVSAGNNLTCRAS
ncbi:ArsR/SmtB family transcription factor [Streptomyces sp. NPDC058676]|uniref:ArsR/SmtB family transcription factor n=1 Tax=unclassified Streptomyces TaxID=2593676 RepID=UPI003658DA51